MGDRMYGVSTQYRVKRVVLIKTPLKNQDGEFVRYTVNLTPVKTPGAPLSLQLTDAELRALSNGELVPQYVTITITKGAGLEETTQHDGGSNVVTSDG